MSQLDFTKVKRTPFVVTLPDEKRTRLLVLTPTKKHLEKLIGLQSMLAELSQDETNTDALDYTYSIVADLMSNNLNKRTVNADYLSGLLSFEDIKIFIEGYSAHIKGLLGQKN